MAVALYGLLPLAAAATTLWTYGYAFGGVTRTTDENSYLLQAYAFLDGCIARPFPPLPDAFQHESTMMIMDQKVGWLSRYPPGHAFWLVPGCWMDRPHLMVALAAALTVFLMARLGALFSARHAWAAALLTALSPWFLFTHGTLLSHTSGLLASAILLYGFVRWQLRGDPRAAVVAGCGWAWLYASRTYTATLMVPPFAVCALVFLVRNYRATKAWTGVLAFAVCAASGVVTVLLYNVLALGNPFTMTYLYYQPGETLGFGPHSFIASTNVHTPAKALLNLVTNIRLLDRWLLGFPGSLVFMLVLAIVGWHRRWSWLLLAVPVLVVGGYVFFWYPGPQESGPGYYLETLPFLALAATLGVVRVWNWASNRSRFVLAGLGAALIAGTGADIAFMAKQGARFHIDNAEAALANQVLRQAPANALVILPTNRKSYAISRRGALVMNVRGTNSQPLVTWTMGDVDPLLGRVYPTRIPFRLAPSDPPRLVALDWRGYAHNERRDCANSHIRTGSRATDVAGQTSIAVVGGRDAPGWMAFGSRFQMTPGTFDITYDLAVTEARPDQLVATVHVTMGDARLAGSVYGGQTNPPVLRFTTTRADSAELSVHYEGVGNVLLRGFRVSDSVAPR